jgi:excisionase family DNA binding protein
MEEYLSPQQAAERKGVAVQTIYKAVSEGRLPSTRILGRIGLSPTDVDAWEPAPYGDREGVKRERGPGRRKKPATEGSQS